MADRDLDKALRAWHASPYDFDRFGEMKDVSGKGQGAAAYGRGAAYVAESPAVSGPGRSTYMEEFERHPAVGQSPYSYEVRVHLKPETMLDWDAPVKDHHPEAVKKIARASLAKALAGGAQLPDAAFDMSKSPATGADVYRNIAYQHNSDFAASEALYNAGIHGIRYADGQSRQQTLKLMIDGELYDHKKHDQEGGTVNGWLHGMKVSTTLDDVEDELRQAQIVHGTSKYGKDIAAARKWIKNNKDRLSIATPTPTYNYVIFHPDFVEAIAQYNIKGEKVRDIAGVHLKQVDHDPFKGE